MPKVLADIKPPTKKLIARLPDDVQVIASSIAKQYFTSVDQIAAVKQAFRPILDPKKEKVSSASAAPLFLSEEDRKAVVKRYQALEAAKAFQHNAEVQKQYIENSDVLPLQEALARHTDAPGEIEGMTTAITQALGLTVRQTNGVFLIEVQDGIPTGCWHLSPSLEKASFWKRVKVFLALIFGIGGGSVQDATADGTLPKSAAELVAELAAKEN